MTAIIRRMDPLGRVVIPKSIREQHTLTLSERVRRLRKEAVQEGASVEVIYQMNQLLDVLEDC